jgi:hypothetical protein
MFHFFQQIASCRQLLMKSWRWSAAVLVVCTMTLGSALVLSQERSRRDKPSTGLSNQIPASQSPFVSNVDEIQKSVEKSESEEPSEDEEKPTEEESAEEKAADENSAEGEPEEEMSTDEKSADETTFDEEKPAAEAPAAEKTEAEKPADAQPEEEMKNEETSTDEPMSEDENPAEDTATEKVEDENPTNTQSEEEMEAEEKLPESNADEPATENEKPAEEEPVTAKPVGEPSAEEKEAEEKDAAEKASADKAAIEKIVTDRLAIERELAEKVANERAIKEKAARDAADAARAVAEKEAADRAIAERIASEKTLIKKIETTLESELNKAKEQLKQSLERRTNVGAASATGNLDSRSLRDEFDLVRRDFESRIDRLERMQTQKYSAWKRAIGGEYYVCTYRCTPVGSDIECINCAYYYPSDPKYVYFFNPKNCVFWGRYIIGTEFDSEWEWLPLNERAITCAGSPPRGQFAWKGPMPLVDQSLDSRQRMLWPSLFGLPGIASELAMRRSAAPLTFIAPRPKSADNSNPANQAPVKNSPPQY